MFNIHPKMKLDVQNILRTLNDTGEEYLLTNGCFDILHIGHIKFLEECYNICKNIIVFVNSDESVKYLKGKDRPINTLYERMFMMSCIEFVKYVIPLNSITLRPIFSKIRPTYWIKGGDWNMNTLNKYEVELAEKNGTKIQIGVYTEDISTTHIINDLKLRN